MLRPRCAIVASTIVCFLIISPFLSIANGEVSPSDDAGDTVDPSVTWYRDQLDPAMRYAYDKVVATEPSGGMIRVTVPSSIIKDTYTGCNSIEDYCNAVSQPINTLFEALYMERPEYNWSDGDCKYQFNFGSAPSLQCNIKLMIVDKEGYQNNSEIRDVIQAMDVRAADFEAISQIHDYLANILSYAYEELDVERASGYNNQSIRNASVALIGTHEVVCTGYAKAFKMACDYYNIPCVIAFGNAGGDSHVWNLVLLDGLWYAVDLTWDDLNTGYRSSYLLCGQKTAIFGEEFSDSHVESMHEINLSLPEPLAQYRYLDDAFKVTFNVDVAETPYVVDILAGDPVDCIEKPSKDGFYFTGWYLDSDRAVLWNPEDGVMSDMVLYAGWSEEPNYTLFFRSSGDGVALEKLKTNAMGEVSVPHQTPCRSGFVFTGWNTKSDGSGTSYIAGDTLILDSDAVLYACWVADESEASENGRENVEGASLLHWAIVVVVISSVLAFCYMRHRR